MTLFRLIPLSAHGAAESLAAPLLMAAPFLLGFGPAAGVASVTLGVLLLGLALATHADRQAIPLSAHALFDYALGLGMVTAGLAFGLAKGDFAATIFLIGAGAAHTALTASTRFSLPRAT